MTGAVAVAILLGIVVLLALFPASGVDTQPPECYAMLFYPVPCETWVAPVATIGVAGIVLVAARLRARPRT